MEEFYLTTIVVLIVLVVWLVYRLIKQSSALRDLLGQLELSNIEIQSLKSEVRDAESRALAMAADQLKRKEKAIRSDAVERSRNVQRGRMAESLAPVLPGFKYDPRDCRFLGSPVDYIIFDGLGAGNLKQIVLLEVKCGKYARLNRREQEVQNAVKEGSCKYEILRIGPARKDKSWTGRTSEDITARTTTTPSDTQ
ncbi:MAG: Holliday junction resolvase-like protein [Acholeplasmataceae bacterium]